MAARARSLIKPNVMMLTMSLLQCLLKQRAVDDRKHSGLGDEQYKCTPVCLLPNTLAPHFRLA